MFLSCDEDISADHLLGVQFGGGQQPVVGMGHQQMMTQGPPGVRTMNAPPQAPQQLLAPHGAHINPQVKITVALMQYKMFPGVHQQPPVPGAVNDVEFEEIMNRNRTVASSAISRAVADAAGGDVKSATETILTAISLIKQSRVAHDDRCRLLVASLQKTKLTRAEEVAAEANTVTDLAVALVTVIVKEGEEAAPEAVQALDRVHHDILAVAITKYGVDCCTSFLEGMLYCYTFNCWVSFTFRTFTFVLL
ncbi:putative flagellar protein FliS [Ancylostoma duodenale]|uniref:Putative flagellar protein FliS n=1 Tax=Ancylostoma duodenale TaxID=51022 RepID=A0A0C2FDC3_9BILA|nr:putative flagellar protein FliS [Ancylostoma duodenale]